MKSVYDEVCNDMLKSLVKGFPKTAQNLPIPGNLQPQESGLDKLSQAIELLEQVKKEKPILVDKLGVIIADLKNMQNQVSLPQDQVIVP